MEAKPPNILLVNFTDKDIAVLDRSGFKAELGYIGRQTEGKYLPYYFPRPPYEYDIYIYNSQIPDQKLLTRLFPSPKNLLEDKDALKVVAKLSETMRLRIAFTGFSSGPENLLLGGLLQIKLLPAHERVTVCLTPKSKRAFSVPELEKTIVNLKEQIAFPIGQYTTVGRDTFPENYLPTIWNRNGDVIASYGTIYDQSESKAVPIYIVLPQLQNNALAILKLFEVLARIRPEPFADVKDKTWYESDEFAFAEERAIDHDIGMKIKEAKSFIETKREEKKEIAARYEFIKAILVATEDQTLAADKRLTTNVKKVLEYLGFSVRDIDAEIRGAIRKEDFWVSDGEFLAITEVTATTNKNPKISEYSALLGRMTTVFKRKDRVPDATNIQGLLIINYDVDTHPMRRPRLYSGDAEEIVEAAKENEIGLLSTVELYRIVLAVHEGKLTKEQGRNILKGVGRVELKGDPG